MATGPLQIRRDTAANWTSTNPVLANAEQGYETDTNLMKVGNGIDDWNTRPYLTGSGGGSVATDAIWNAAGDLAVGTGSGTAGILPMGSALQSLRVNAGGTDLEYATIAGTGDVVGPASATDNAIVRFDSTTGKLIQDSAATIADTTGDITAGKYNTVAISGSSTPTLAVTGTSTISGTNTGDQTTVTGNAGTATVLATARTINGVSFNGSANITVTAAAGTLSGTTLAAAVVNSSLTTAAGGTFGTAAFTAASAYATASHTHTASNVTDFSEAVDDRVAALLMAGTNITLTYNDVAGTLTIDASGGGGSPGGSTTQVQFNDAGSFAGDADFVWDKTTNTLSVNGTVSVGGGAILLDSGVTSTTFVTTGYVETPTAGGTTTLTATSEETQNFTGTANQTVVLPDVSVAPLTLGRNFRIINSGTGILTIQTSTATIITYVYAGGEVNITAKELTLNTAASWQVCHVGSDVQTVTAGGTWYKRAGVKMVRVTCWPGGGGGGSARRGAAGTVRCGGGGGGAGSPFVRLYAGTDLGATESMSIGAGGSAGAARTTDDTDGATGGNGGGTDFGSAATLCRANGGSGGGQGTATAGAAGSGSTPTNVVTTNGSAASGTGAAGTSGSINAAAMMTNGGGGSGGGITSGNTQSAGGNLISNATLAFMYNTTSGSGAGTAGGGAGTAGIAGRGPWQGGSGGAGGGSNATGAGGAGGAGGFPGGGGGGGGASPNVSPGPGGNSGAGGVGGAGCIYVECFF